MSRLEKRIARLEAEKTDPLRSAGTPEDCCASFGFKLKEAVAKFGAYPSFCYAMLIRPEGRDFPSTAMRRP